MVSLTVVPDRSTSDHIPDFRSMCNPRRDTMASALTIFGPHRTPYLCGEYGLVPQRPSERTLGRPGGERRPCHEGGLEVLGDGRKYVPAHMAFASLLPLSGSPVARGH